MIYYFLTDDTVYVTEPKVENSGIIQGVFIKRQKVPRTLDERYDYYHWKDFNISVNMNFFGRVFRIVDCDDFTKVAYPITFFNLF